MASSSSGIGGIYGLSGSGMDVDDMVTKMMQAEQAKYDKLYKQKTKQTWIKESYYATYDSLQTFQMKTMSNYKLQSSMAAKKATSANESVVSVQANADAAEMNHDVTVKKLASSAYLQTKDGITRSNPDASSSIKLTDIANIDVNGKNADDVALSFTLKDSADGTEHVISYTYGEIGDMTLNDVAADINALDSNVQASYDSVNDSFSLYNKNGGESNTITLGIKADDNADAKANGQTLLNNLGLAQYDNASKTLGEVLSVSESAGLSVQGTSAEIVVDGKTYKSDSNRIMVNSVAYTLNGVSAVTGQDADGNAIYESSRVNVTNDVENTVEQVKKFVEDYNKLLEELNGKIYEKADSSYEPLTDEEKAKLSEDEIKKLEDKAKAGLLSGDSILRDIVSKMRTAISQSVDGVGSAYNLLGISTGTYKEYGKLTLDEDKLRESLNEDPDIAYKVLGNRSDDPDEQGLAYRLSDIAKTAQTTLASKAGSTEEVDDQSSLGLKIASLSEKMTKQSNYMENYRQRLYKQFNAMETAIASLNQQYNFVSSYFSS